MKVEKIHPDSKNHLNQTPKSPTIWRASPMAILTPLKLDRELHVHACNLSKRSKDAAWRKTLVEAKDEGDSYGQSRGRTPEGGFCKFYKQKILYANTMIYVKIRYLYTVIWKNFHIFYVHLREKKKTKGKCEYYIKKKVWMHWMYHILYTLQGINISHLGKRKIISKMPFFGDMLVPWRVYIQKTHQPPESSKSNFAPAHLKARSDEEIGTAPRVSVHWNCQGGLITSLQDGLEKGHLSIYLYISCSLFPLKPANHQSFRFRFQWFHPISSNVFHPHHDCLKASCQQ